VTINRFATAGYADVRRHAGGHPKEDLSMRGTFTPSDSALLLIDHQIGTMKLIKNPA